MVKEIISFEEKIKDVSSLKALQKAKPHSFAFNSLLFEKKKKPLKMRKTIFGIFFLFFKKQKLDYLPLVYVTLTIFRYFEQKKFYRFLWHENVALQLNTACIYHVNKKHFALSISSVKLLG